MTLNNGNEVIEGDIILKKMDGGHDAKSSQKSQRDRNLSYYNQRDKRGVIFNDNTDKDRFLEIMEKTKDETNYELYAYCLIVNPIYSFIFSLNTQEYYFLTG